MDLIQRRGSSLELKIPSIQIIFQTTFSFFFGQRITVESCFHGTSSEPKKLSLLSVRTRNFVSLNRRKRWKNRNNGIWSSSYRVVAIIKDGLSYAPYSPARTTPQKTMVKADVCRAVYITRMDEPQLISRRGTWCANMYALSSSIFNFNWITVFNYQKDHKCSLILW